MRELLRYYFNPLPDKENEEQTVKQIAEGISFRGANLCVLILAIFIASLGLNLNSTAVIIGAMLISPLMGPILGMGLGVGILDFDLLKRSARNYGVATVISILTASLYFLISPLSEAQSELLARTSPTIYDVLIALLGGAAGILALSTRTHANVIPGVAIATALMPPLCTAGYGLATGQWLYAAGAFYLFFINTVFIALSTFMGVKLLRFRKHHYVNAERMHRVQRYIWGGVFVTLVPAAYLTLGIVQKSWQANRVRQFVQTELVQNGTEFISTEINPVDSILQIVAVGREIPKSIEQEAQRRMPQYGLTDYRLLLIQGNQRDSLIKLGAVHLSEADQKEKLHRQTVMLEKAERRLKPYVRQEELGESIAMELPSIFPQVAQIALCHAQAYDTDSLHAAPQHNAIIVLRQGTSLSEAAAQSLEQWLRKRTRQDSLKLILKK